MLFEACFFSGETLIFLSWLHNRLAKMLHFAEVHAVSMEKEVEGWVLV